MRDWGGLVETDSKLRWGGLEVQFKLPGRAVALPGRTQGGVAPGGVEVGVEEVGPSRRASSGGAKAVPWGSSSVLSVLRPASAWVVPGRALSSGVVVGIARLIEAGQGPGLSDAGTVGGAGVRAAAVSGDNSAWVPRLEVSRVASVSTF